MKNIVTKYELYIHEPVNNVIEIFELSENDFLTFKHDIPDFRYKTKKFSFTRILTMLDNKNNDMTLTHRLEYTKETL